MRSAFGDPGAQVAHAVPAASSIQPKSNDLAPKASRSAFKRLRVIQASTMMPPPTCRGGSGLSSPRDALRGYSFGAAAVASRPRATFVPGAQIEVYCTRLFGQGVGVMRR